MQPCPLLSLAGFVSRVRLGPREDKSEAGMPRVLSHGLLKTGVSGNDQIMRPPMFRLRELEISLRYTF